MKIRILRENKKDCFQKKDFEAKSNCIQKQKGIPKDNSNAYVASVLRDKDELKKVEELEEVSSGAGGAGAGFAGSIGDPYEIKKENEEEKKRSHLNELFSTSGTMGGIKIRFSDGNKQHAGHVERSQRDGLRNVMEDEEDEDKAEDTFRFDPEDEEQLFSPDEEEEINDDATGVLQPKDKSIEKSVADDFRLFLDSDRDAFVVVDEVIPQIINTHGFEKLFQAALDDSTARDRIRQMTQYSNFTPLKSLLASLDHPDGEVNRETQMDLEDYYRFLALEFWFLGNLKSGWRQQGVGEENPELGAAEKKKFISWKKSSQREAKIHMLMGFMESYLYNPNKYNPAAKSKRFNKEADEYQLDKDLQGSLYHLPE
jgi:hypothetical protein